MELGVNRYAQPLSKKELFILDSSHILYCYFFYYKKIHKEREWLVILEIKKNEAFLLNSMGVPFGENGISTSKTRHKKYYICENKKNMKLLSKIKNYK